MLSSSALLELLELSTLPGSSGSTGGIELEDDELLAHVPLVEKLETVVPVDEAVIVV